MRLILGALLTLTLSSVLWSCDSASKLSSDLASNENDSSTSGQDSVETPFEGLTAEQWITEKYEKYDLYCKLKNFETTSGHYFIEKEIPVLELMKNPEKSLFINLEGDYSKTQFELKVSQVTHVDHVQVVGNDLRNHDVYNAPGVEVSWVYHNERQIDPEGTFVPTAGEGHTMMYENVPMTLFGQDAGIDTAFGLFIGADCKINAVPKGSMSTQETKTETESM